jgi:hypothetical protein
MGHCGLFGKQGFLAPPVILVLLPELARTPPYAWRTSRVDTPAPPLYTRPHALCDRLSSVQP